MITKQTIAKSFEDKSPKRSDTDIASDQQPGTLNAMDADGVYITPFFRTGYNYNRDVASDETALVCLDPSLTQQQFVDDADINTIVSRFGLTGQMPEQLRFPQYGDFTGISNLQDALNVGRAAQEAFMLIPPEVRAEFNNDPHVFMEAVHEPRNLPFLRELGLARPLGLPEEQKGEIPPSTARHVDPAGKPAATPPAKGGSEQSTP